jgi:uncharacterized protein (DUF1778 family)
VIRLAVIKKDSITIRVTPRFKQKLERIANDRGHSISDFIRYEMEKIVESEDNKRNLDKNNAN